MKELSFNFKLYQQTWQRLSNSQNQIKTLTQQLDIATPIPLHIFDSIPSTNTKLWELIDGGIEIPVGAIALQQTAGKGQWGKSWFSPDGGLYLSVALSLDLAIINHPHLVMATAWGITIVLRHYQLPVTIKWSNDLILEQRKLGGIKIETRNSHHKIIQAVVGVGINWCNPVPAIGINLQSYYQDKSQKNITSLEELAAITTYGVLLGYRYYLSVGIEQLLIDYLAILSSLGQQVMFNNCPGKVTGVTIEGKLKVRLRSPGATTEITFAQGQISLGY